MHTLSDEQTAAFTEALLSLKREAINDLSQEDFRHLKKIVWLNRFFLVLGYGTAWLIPNPLSMLFISIGLHGNWTIVAHHVLHKGYDKVPHTPTRYTSHRFAKGWRRVIDWFDWIYPPAWCYEHNVLHHFYTNERLDPDILHFRLHERHAVYPLWIKIMRLLFIISTWKATYYSKNTLKGYAEKKQFSPEKNYEEYRFKSYLYNYLPYISFNFLLLPLFFLALGWKAVLFVFINRIGAEILTNIHAFFTILPNHVGPDIRFQTKHFENQSAFFMAQINASSNYHTGGFWCDYFQGYLNYQIEHHLFPDLPVSQYVKLQPKVKKLCDHYKIPYKQESIIIRVKKMLSILLQFNKMEWAD